MIFESSRRDNSIPKLCNSDIVLASYGELVKSLPQPDPQTVKNWKDHELDVGQCTLEWIQKNRDGAGLLHKVPWYRVSLYIIKIEIHTNLVSQ